MHKTYSLLMGFKIKYFYTLGNADSRSSTFLTEGFEKEYSYGAGKGYGDRFGDGCGTEGYVNGGGKARYFTNGEGEGEDGMMPCDELPWAAYIDA